MTEQKIKEVFSDKAFVESLMTMETPEEVQKALAEKDIDLSVDEINKTREMLQKKANGELSEEDLADVAGGDLIIGLCILQASLIAIGVSAGITERVTRRRW